MCRKSDESWLLGHNVKLRGTPTMKPEQRACLDDTHDLEMPRQGVSLLNDMLGPLRDIFSALGDAFCSPIYVVGKALEIREQSNMIYSIDVKCLQNIAF